MYSRINQILTEKQKHTLEVKAQTEFSLAVSVQPKKFLKKQIESYEKASEKPEEVTQSLNKTKETNQSRSNAVPSKLSFAEVVSGVNQEQFEQK